MIILIIVIMIITLIHALIPSSSEIVFNINLNKYLLIWFEFNNQSYFYFSELTLDHWKSISYLSANK